MITIFLWLVSELTKYAESLLIHTIGGMPVKAMKYFVCNKTIQLVLSYQYHTPSHIRVCGMPDNTYNPIEFVWYTI